MDQLFHALLGSGGVPVEVVFTTSQTWVAPAGVALLASAIGNGSGGSPATTATEYLTAGVVQYYASGSGNTGGVYTWDTFYAAISTARSTINAGGSGTVGIPNAIQYSNTSYSAFISNYGYSNAIAGTAVLTNPTGGYVASGNVTSAGSVYLAYDYPVAATAGSASAGFGLNFPGGVGGSAPTTSYTNVAITPGGSYLLTIPAGGSLTITYYQ